MTVCLPHTQMQLIVFGFCFRMRLRAAVFRATALWAESQHKLANFLSIIRNVEALRKNNFVRAKGKGVLRIAVLVGTIYENKKSFTSF